MRAVLLVDLIEGPAMRASAESTTVTNSISSTFVAEDLVAAIELQPSSNIAFIDPNAPVGKRFRIVGAVDRLRDGTIRVEARYLDDIKNARKGTLCTRYFTPDAALQRI